MNRPVTLSYYLFGGLLVLMGCLHLATPFLTILFVFLILEKLRIATRSKWVAITLMILLMAFLSWGSIYFSRQMVTAMPEMLAKTIPSMIDYLDNHGVTLPFENHQGLKTMLVESVQNQWGNIGKLAGNLVHQVAFVIIGLVIAVGLFLNKELDIERHTHPISNNYYSLTLEALAARFRSFFLSFERVMGAQVTISILNTGFTAIFTTFCHLPYPVMLIGVTFLCGLFPIIGNLISNTVIIGVAFTVSPKTALAALIFLVVIHKLEYFLNSKIIGDRIKNPVWLTLLGLLIGERLLGIPGMILAPVLLNFIKVEASQTAVPLGEKALDQEKAPENSKSKSTEAA